MVYGFIFGGGINKERMDVMGIKLKVIISYVYIADRDLW